MKIVIAIDSFKGSMTSFEAGTAAAKGFQNQFPHAEIVVKPIADGGEGTVNALVEGLRGTYCQTQVQDPLGRNILAQYGIIDKTAVIEISAAAGIALLKEEERNPKITSTYGIGQLIKDAILRGCRDFIIGIGGSATNDGGVGMLQALGFDFLDAQGYPIPSGAEGLSKIFRIDTQNALVQLKDCHFQIACDVTNPLCGENGCSYIFSRQKGAKEEDIPLMDSWIAHYAHCTKSVFPNADSDFPGAGAAGGLGFAFRTYLNATLTSGIDLILSKIGMEAQIQNADLVITGEGKIDSQTIMGKAPIGIAKLAKKHGKPVIAFAGFVTEDAGICCEHGINAIIPIVHGPCSLTDAMNPGNAQSNMRRTANQVANILSLHLLTGENL